MQDIAYLVSKEMPNGWTRGIVVGWGIAEQYGLGILALIRECEAAVRERIAEFNERGIPLPRSYRPDDLLKHGYKITALPVA